ncbi:hypothetical protein GEMRC1_003243 [Eukaryota sp. GEM-RC1]
MPFTDIGANLTDGAFQGFYFGKKVHDADLTHVINRSLEANVNHIIVTSGTLADTKAALNLCSQHEHLSTTVGIHPTRSSQVLKQGNVDQYIAEMQDIVRSSSYISCLGEMGLDYDRFKFSSKQQQHDIFDLQLKTLVAEDHKQLPLFLHSRNSTSDMLNFISDYSSIFSSRDSVIHSFTDGVEAMDQFLSKGSYIGINGCSLRTKEGLEAVKQLPLDRLLLETDAPYCSIKATHPSFEFVSTKHKTVKRERYVTGAMVKDRNEPCNVVQVCEVIAAVKKIDVEEVERVCEANAQRFLRK